MWHVSCTFYGYPALIKGFNDFLEGRYCIEYITDGDVNIRIPMSKDSTVPSKGEDSASTLYCEEEQENLGTDGNESSEIEGIQSNPGPSYFRLPASVCIFILINSQL